VIGGNPGISITCGASASEVADGDGLGFADGDGRGVADGDGLGVGDGLVVVLGAGLGELAAVDAVSGR
jgi:hypothetical protein